MGFLSGVWGGLGVDYIGGGGVGTMGFRFGCWGNGDELGEGKFIPG